MVCFFKQKTSYERRISDWSSDVCSSDLGHALVLLVRMTGQHPEAGAADDGVLRRALDVVPVGQVADPELEGRLLLHAGITSRGLGEDGAFAAAKAGAALVAAAGQIGRAAGRARVGPSGLISVVGGTLKKKNN